MRRYTSTHWGIYEVVGSPDAPRLVAFDGDPDPSEIGFSMLDAVRRLRVMRPSVRRSCLEHGMGAAPELRGLEPFVEVDWDTALDLAAGALRSTIDGHGNRAVFGGSYGWGSAGRFHHAQSQIHRFLNCLGGYVRHTDSYSLGAARVLMPHIVAPMDELIVEHTSWNVLREHTQLFVTFGGDPRKNAQVNPGGAGEHLVRGGLAAMAHAGVEFVNVSPVRDDLDTGAAFQWVGIRPNTDTAMMLGLAYELHRNGWHDRVFLERYCVGFDRFERYLTGQSDGLPKDAPWASTITGVATPVIVDLAARMASKRTMLNAAWSLQRAHHGEQPYWMLVTLAAMLGQIGMPGGGFGVGYGATGVMGNANPRFTGPTLPQGRAGIPDFIPVARIADLLERPGETFSYNGSDYQYAPIRLIFWAGGNPFHHHQDLARLAKAWRTVPHVIVNEQFWTANARMADIVLPATTTLERDDIGFATRERYMVAMKKVIEPVGEARSDYEIFSALADRLGVAQAFTESRSERDWLRHIYDDCRPRARLAGIDLPAFDDFWDAGLIDTARADQSLVMLEQFRDDPAANPLRTPSGRIEIFSERIAGFGYDDCPGHPTWLEPAEWLGAEVAQARPFHLISDQPHTKLHSQLDHSALSAGNRIEGREPVLMHPQDAAALGIVAGDVVRVFNDRGSCLAGAVLSEGIRRGVLKLSTGAWLDPADWRDIRDDKHGNPNILTLDIGASGLSQGCIAQTCLVSVEKFTGVAPVVTAHTLPPIVAHEPRA